ncbi:hypothetical protein [Halorubrum sp. DTA46]|uniref:hypothetical protein n=1 Tax=Halorubrum sp. DTA46 TaxID=3402162 RepID=UPI003AABCFDE
MNTTPLKLALVVVVGLGLFGAVATVGAHDAGGHAETELPAWSDHADNELIGWMDGYMHGDHAHGEHRDGNHAHGEHHDGNHAHGEHRDGNRTYGEGHC